MNPSNPLVRVEHPDVEGTALVPAKSQLISRGQWHVVDDQVDDAGSDSAAPEATVDKPSTAKKSPRTRATTSKEK